MSPRPDGITSDFVGQEFWNPTTVFGLSGVSDLELGSTNSCARLADGTVWCWGENSAGQLGIGNTMDQPVATAVVGLTGARGATLGDTSTCAWGVNGTAQCWGSNTAGLLGTGDTIDRTTPGTVVGLNNVAEIRLGRSHSCARLIDGSVRCWGSGGAGELGDASIVGSGSSLTRRFFSATPVLVALFPPANECDVVAGTPAAEICGDAIDNDCDGINDNGC